MGKLTCVLVALLVLAGCGAGSEVPTVGSEPRLNEREQEVYEFVTLRVDEMQALVDDTMAIFDGELDLATVTAKMEPIASSYADLCDDYNATLEGGYAGGRVARLEKLWERCGNNIRTADRAILDCYLDPDGVDTDEGAEALVAAQRDVKLVREELAAIEGE